MWRYGGNLKLTASRLYALTKPPADVNATDSRAGVSLQKTLAALGDSVKSKIGGVTKKLISAGSDCTTVGDDWGAVNKAVCNRVAGIIDISWFSCFLTAIGMLFFSVVIAKIVKRIDDTQANDELHKPLVDDVPSVPCWMRCAACCPCLSAGAGAAALGQEKGNVPMAPYQA